MNCKVNIGDIFIDQKGNYHKIVRLCFFSEWQKENLYMTDKDKFEYESTILKEWEKTNLQYSPGEQISLF